MGTDPDDRAGIRDPTIELLLGHNRHVDRCTVAAADGPSTTGPAKREKTFVLHTERVHQDALWPISGCFNSLMVVSWHGSSWAQAAARQWSRFTDLPGHAMNLPS